MMTFEEIGTALGVSAERARQIYNVAVQKFMFGLIVRGYRLDDIREALR